MGGAGGWVANDYFAGWAECTGDWDNTMADYLSFNDTVQLRRLSKTARCLDCNKKIPRPNIS